MAPIRVPALHVPVSQRRLLAAALAFVLLAVVGVRHLGSHVAAAPVVAPVRAAASPRTPAARLVVVDVAGAVRRPGLYRLRSGDRVADAVARAGGLARSADRVAVNLAAPLSDGEQVIVPVRVRGAPPGVAAAPAAASTPGAAAPSTPVNLNTATAEQLDALPGVGPVTAQKILVYREQHGPFTDTAELDAIPGIGPARLHDLEGLVTP